MILGAADHQRLEFVLARDAAEEGPEIRLEFRLDQVAAQFCGEHAMDEIGDVGVRHVASVGVDSRDWPRENVSGRFCFPVLGMWVVDQVPPTGHAADVSHVPGVGNAGLLSVVLRDKLEREPAVLSNPFGANLSCESGVFSYRYGTSARQPAIVSYRSGKRRMSTNIPWLRSFPQT